MGATVALMAAGTALSAFSAVQQGQAAASQAKYQSAVAKNNQKIAQQKADDARARGDEAARRQAVLTQQEIGATRAQAASRGVVVDEGSTLRLQEDVAAAGKLDELTVRRNAEREALGFEQQAAEFGVESQFRESAAETRATSGFLNAGATLLSGGGKVASKWHDLKESE